MGIVKNTLIFFMLKKLFLLLLLFVATSGPAFAIFDKYTISRDELPEKACEMLDQYFPKAKISMIKVDKHLLKKTDYDVKLLNGTKIEFNNSGSWTSVDCGKRELPSELLSKTIRNYISKNYADSKIVSVKKRSGGFDVGLSCGRQLRFNVLHQFKGEIDGSTPDTDEDTEIEEV